MNGCHIVKSRTVELHGYIQIFDELMLYTGDG